MTRHELVERYRRVRAVTEAICAPLKAEDHVPQPIADVSPPKWHLGHVTWFIEQMFLEKYVKGYKPFNPDYAWIFNSYYDSFGVRVERPLRGTLSRPALTEIMTFRTCVDERMVDLIETVRESEWASFSRMVILSLNHEQQHQELLLTDLKYVLACNPTRPAYATRDSAPPARQVMPKPSFFRSKGGCTKSATKDRVFITTTKARGIACISATFNSRIGWLRTANTSNSSKTAVTSVSTIGSRTGG